MSIDIPRETKSKNDSKETASLPPKDKAAPSHANTGNSFAEVALRLGGASADEAKRTGVIDTADDQVEDLFADPYKTANSPIHRAVWDRKVPTMLFAPDTGPCCEQVRTVIDTSRNLVRRRRSEKTLYDDKGKISTESLSELAKAGFWGMLVDKQYGGSGATMREFVTMITEIASVDPTVAGLASVHGCIGAVDPVRAFGDEDQKRRFLPGLADGSRLSGFALTEPGAGSDLTALATTAHLDGDHYVVNGEKLFITNATYGRTIGLVCKIDDRPSVLIVELPQGDTDTFQIKPYEIFALKRAHNNGLVFRNFRVPAQNRLLPDHGDGLTIAYHGLNLGRVSLCANAAGTMRQMLSEMIPWANFRKTYGQAIAKRELVQRRIGHMAGLIVACDALSYWCANLLDRGFRGEMECIVAKIFGSEAQKEAAIELFMKTHGGRSFLGGHLFGDNVHDLLAPCIYEGEGEMLGMAFFKSLVKQHGKDYFEPIGRTLHDLGVSQPSLVNPRHLLALRKPMWAYAKWYAKHSLPGSRWSDEGEGTLPRALRKHVRVAQDVLSQSGMLISATMRRHQLKLADRQCRMSALSSRVQNAVVMLVTALYASQQTDAITRLAADGICRELTRRIHGGLPQDADFRLLTRVGGMIADEQWIELQEIDASEILQRY